MTDIAEERLTKLAAIRQAGLSGYDEDGANFREEPITSTALGYVLGNPEKEPEGGWSNVAGPTFGFRGRVVLRRVMGNLHFLTVRDQEGDFQVALRKNALTPEAWALASLVDLGDVLRFEGHLAPTQKGEPTLWATAFAFSAKSLVVPPSKLEGLQDVDARYRRRHVDLWSNPEVARTFMLRSRIIARIRSFLNDDRWLEVETPSMHPVPGGAIAEPFTTHHDALDMPIYMRVAPELYLKRLIVGGFDAVYEIGKNYRNEGLSPRHNPEFTALEMYRVGADADAMKRIVKTLIAHVAAEFHAPWLTQAEQDATGFHNPFAAGFDEVSMADAVERHYSTSNETKPEGDDFHLYETVVERTLLKPTFVHGLPSAAVPLAKAEGGKAMSWELVVGGREIACGYTEQNDPEEQLRVLLDRAGGDRSRVDWDFIDALRVGMPKCGGVGMGIDRLVMLFTGMENIRDVILFPTMRPRA